MVLTSGIPLTTFWIMGAIVLLAALAVGGFGLYSPTLRRQIRLFETVGADNEEFRGLMKRGMIHRHIARRHRHCDHGAYGLQADDLGSVGKNRRLTSPPDRERIHTCARLDRNTALSNRLVASSTGGRI